MLDPALLEIFPLAVFHFAPDSFGQRAEAWWRRHSGEHRYVGVRNLDARLAMSVRDFPEEWTTP